MGFYSWTLEALLGIRTIPTEGNSEDFPGGPVVKNLPSNIGDMGSIPGQGTKSLCPLGQLSPWAAARENHTHHDGDSTSHEERSWVLQLRPEAAKNKLINI